MTEIVERVRAWLGWPHHETARLSALAASVVDGPPMEIPDGDELREILSRLDVPPHAIEELENAMPAKASDPEAWWLLERLHAQLIHPGDSVIPPPWPAPEPSVDALSRYFHLFVFLAAVPTIRGLHAKRGISDDVSWGTLADVGLQVAHYQTRNGRPGFDGAFWMWQHFRGDIYRLGRLQYDLRSDLFDPGAFGLHIPARGPLTPEACAASLEQAGGFFPRHFPEYTYRTAACGSWLLDEQLAEYLPPTANIIQFQKRFSVVPGWSRPGDKDVLLFAFGHVPKSIDDLPQTTSLARAVVQHLRDGRHWQIRLGCVEL